MRLMAIILAAHLFAACGSNNSSSDDNTKKLDGITYVVVDAGTLEHKSTEVTGTGSFAINAPTKEAGNSYAWTGTIADEGSVTLYTNAEEGLKNGVALQFTRAGEALSVKVSNSDEDVDVSASFSSIDASEALSFQIDVHNDENPAHIMIWPGSATTFDEATALFNSEDDGEAPGQGSGSIWGFALSNATLTAASVSEPKFEDE